MRIKKGWIEYFTEIYNSKVLAWIVFVLAIIGLAAVPLAVVSFLLLTADNRITMVFMLLAAIPLITISTIEGVRKKLRNIGVIEYRVVPRFIYTPEYYEKEIKKVDLKLEEFKDNEKKLKGINAHREYLVGELEKSKKGVE